MHAHRDPHPPLRRRSTRRFAIFAALVLIPTTFAAASATAGGPAFSDWSTADKIDTINGNHEDLNSTAVDGCPIQAPDGLSLYIASTRPGGHGGLDIWMSTRRHRGDSWGAPVNLPAPINSGAADFCPTPIEGHGLFFVSSRSIPGVTCGMGDIYFARRNPAQGWTDPEHLACAPDGPNSVLDEQGPSFVQGQLYFSRSAPPVPNVSPAVLGELFVSVATDEGFAPATAIAELNDAGANDIQPNVRKDGREIVFSSNRGGGAGGQDIWSSTRSSVDAPWSPPVNLASVNTGYGESRPSLSNDAQQLLFGRAGPVGTGEGGTGLSDVHVSTRQRNP